MVEVIPKAKGVVQVWFKKDVWLLLGLVSVLSVSVALSYPIPVGADICFHLKIARVWASGENGMFSDIALTVNKMPYPPLFHWLLVPGVWGGFEFEWARFIQALIFPLALASILYSMIKLGRGNPAIGGLLLLGSAAYYDRLLQATPQGLDMILYPLSVLALIEKRWNWFALISILLVYNHGMVALAMLGGSFIHLFMQRKYKVLMAIGLATSFILIPTGFYLVSGMGEMVGSGTGQERAFWSTPLSYTLRYLGTIALVIPLMKGVKISDPLHRLILLNSGSLLIMFPFWPERFLSYIAPNLAHLQSETIDSRFLFPLSYVIGVFHLLPWILLFSGGFHTVC